MSIFGVNRDRLSDRPMCCQFVDKVKSVSETCHNSAMFHIQNVWYSEKLRYFYNRNVLYADDVLTVS